VMSQGIMSKMPALPPHLLGDTPGYAFPSVTGPDGSKSPASSPADDVAEAGSRAAAGSVVPPSGPAAGSGSASGTFLLGGFQAENAPNPIVASEQRSGAWLDSYENELERLKFNTGVPQQNAVPGQGSSETAAEHDSVEPPGLTVYFGGAGQNGPYVQDQIKALNDAGITDAVPGVFSKAGIVANHFLVDATAGVKQLSDRVQYDTGFTDGIMGVPYKAEVDWSLPSTAGISLPEGISRPRGGQFNLIGYSYGALVAAQTAAYYADKGQYVNNLVLIGSPISEEFLSQLQSNSNIGNVIVRNLTFNKDPIYAGIPYSELVASASLLAYDMVADPQAGTGHFYYVPDNQTGQTRRAELAQQLYESGLRWYEKSNEYQ
jgi:hypothetical protein